jgi:dTDP-4-dehydrorhamnose 3,5-epimerase
MLLRPLDIDGLFEITAPRNEDERGFFMRSYDRQAFEASGLETRWEQESLSFNEQRFTIRGLHFQLPPVAETKIVRVTRGAAMDVALDLRRESPTFGRHVAIELSAEKGNAVYIPAGFAHGFQTLEDDTLLEYKINVGYRTELAAGVRWNDPSLAIKWHQGDISTSPRDAELPLFADLVSPF